MKIAIYYDDYRRIGRNDGAPLYAKYALEQMGHQVDHLIPDERRLDGHKDYDLNFWVDWGEDALLSVGRLDYEPIRIPHPGVYWASDTHLGYDYRLRKSREADYVFCMQKRAVEEFEKDGVKATWIPHAFEPFAYPRKSIIHKYDVCFVGHVNSENRKEFLNDVFAKFPNFWYGQRLFEEAAAIYSQSKIVLNPPIKDDLNMRVFETLGTGSFLLTKDIPTIHEFFEDGKHLVLYKDTQDAIEKARYYLEHNEERKAIAAAGYDEAVRKHTYQHRIAEILKAVKSQEKEKEPCLR